MNILASFTAVVASLAAYGCAVGPDFQSPAAPTAQSYTHDAQPVTAEAAGTTQTFTRADTALPMWWTQFGSAALNRLVDTALYNSPTLAQAQARLTEARENYVAQAGATEYPAIDASFSTTRQKVDLNSFGITSVPSPGPFTVYNASLSVSYALDIFGGNRRTLEGLMAQVNYEAYELEAAKLSLAGNVVANAIRRASLQQQIDLTERLADTQAHQLSIVERRFAAGGVSMLDVRTQRTLLAQTRATLPPLSTQLAQTDHQLAVLLGSAPSDADFHDITLDSLRLPSNVPVTLPSTLAQERPDIRASEALLHQASANVGVAAANMYPQLAISAAIGSERTRMADVLSGMNIWNVGLNLTQPLFHGGELRAKKRAAQADYDAALASYQQTVLQALQQVADALQALDNDARTLSKRSDAQREAQASLSIAQAQYAAGAVSQFSLLDTQRSALQTVLDESRAQADRLSDTAMLFQSLGRAW
ncbi:efflux transporter outer membrane subunit [Caballeronia sp. M1242]|uniref:efflux transporter outer membrane subunit n=1 Tax=Caballeronia sp. M1242 TaxID=2814653 RepID=UPI0019D00C9A|nr:efflux transporter outer membrane subunit [Caballeronia sp. M1242]QSN64332.1 efflux transporter outer membrane subunit [Caballeronia sp. M1242]